MPAGPKAVPTASAAVVVSRLFRFKFQIQPRCLLEIGLNAGKFLLSALGLRSQFFQLLGYPCEAPGNSAGFAQHRRFLLCGPFALAGPYRCDWDGSAIRRQQSCGPAPDRRCFAPELSKQGLRGPSLQHPLCGPMPP